MTDNQITPPQYANVPAWILYHKDIPDGAVRFYAQIKGLAWKSKGKTTPEISMEELQAITGKKHTAIYGYMTLLGILAGLRFQTANKGTFIFTFDEETGFRKNGNAESLLTTTPLTINDSKELSSRRGISAKTEKRKNGIPKNPLEASEHPDISVFRAACGAFPGVSHYKTVIDTIQFLREKKGFAADDLLVEFLKPYALNWAARKTRFKTDYNPADVAWLVEWAVNERIPPEYQTGAKKQNNSADALSEFAAEIGAV